MTSRQRWTWLLSVVSLVAGFALITAAFAVSAPSAHAKKFSTFRAVFDTVDYLDPAQSYTAQSWSVMYDTYDTLVTYPHLGGRAGGRLVPGLAAAMPRISNGGRTYTFKLRAGLKYSNGAPLKATDFKFSIKRLYEGASQGVGFYTGIVGAAAYAKSCETKCKGDIAGVIGNNAKRTVTFRLTKARGDFLSIMALIFASPVPSGTPATDQSTKDLPATGAYHIVNYVPNQGFSLVRNKFFKPTKYEIKPNPDKITVKLIGDASAATQQVIGNKADYSNGAIPPDRLGDVSRKYKKYLKLYAGANTYYFWMNTKKAPFNKVNVRKAVNYAINRPAYIRAVFGGLGRPTQNVLPPNYPSYRKLNLYKFDLNKARNMIKAAGVDGTHITVWGRAVDDSKQATELYADTLDKIGFKTTIKILPRATYYTTIGNADTPDRDTGWARWLEDYPHPSDWFDVLLNGNRITAQNNNNYSNADVAKINNLIEKLNTKPLSSSVNKQWANVDKLIMQQALWVPWVNRVFTDFFSKRVNMKCYVDHPIYHFDFARVCPA